jgi:hypothetical protein
VQGIAALLLLQWVVRWPLKLSPAGHENNRSEMLAPQQGLFTRQR